LRDLPGKVICCCVSHSFRWSVDANVPDLGDASTPYEQVTAFYNFWFNFKSWRDFSFADEFDPNEAESRLVKCRSACQQLQGMNVDGWNAKMNGNAKRRRKRRLKEYLNLQVLRYIQCINQCRNC
jgi:hypothetical protein